MTAKYQTKKTSELEVGDVIVNHGMRLLVETELRLSTAHDDAHNGTRWTRARVLNRDELSAEQIPFSFTAPRGDETEPHFTIQGNDLATWSVEPPACPRCERWSTGARLSSADGAGEPRPTGFVVGTIVEHVDSGQTGTIVGRAIAQRSAGGALMQRVKWDHGFKQSDEGAPTFVSRLREHVVDDAGIEQTKSELTRRQEKRAAREAAKTERRKMLDGLAAGDLVRVTGSREGGTEQSYTGTIRRLGSSGTVLIDDAEQTDGAGTPTLHYCSSGTVEKIEPSAGAGSISGVIRRGDGGSAIRRAIERSTEERFFFVLPPSSVEDVLGMIESRS